MRARHLLLVWSLAALIPSANGQELSEKERETLLKTLVAAQLGTTAFQAETYTTQGQLSGCGWSFTHVLFDEAYRQGKPSKLTGSLNTIYAKGRSLTFLLKIKGEDLSIEPNLQIASKTFKIPHAHVEPKPGLTSSGRYSGTFECEGGGFCAVFEEPFAETLEAIASKSLAFGYQRKADGLDVRFTLDPSKLPEADAEILEGVNCYQRLIRRFEELD